MKDKPLTEKDFFCNERCCNCGYGVDFVDSFKREDVLSAVRLLKKNFDIMLLTGRLAPTQTKVVKEKVDECFQLEEKK